MATSTHDLLRALVGLSILAMCISFFVEFVYFPQKNVVEAQQSAIKELKESLGSMRFEDKLLSKRLHNLEAKQSGVPLSEAEEESRKPATKKEKKDKKEEEAENGTFAAIWKEGDEEADKDWLGGGGLSFHVTADKAFKMDADRARATLEIFDPLAKQGNLEVLAHARKKASEGMIPMRRKGPGTVSKDKGDGKGDGKGAGKEDDRGDRRR
mmetsp:Transcript_152521/g.487374  ORF Transcript_152521/g.487374 Transcript_152521/m.487374 type:complete len:211 (-) Transcript_152521:65-697(-)